jgi:hypothetical protein
MTTIGDPYGACGYHLTPIKHGTCSLCGGAVISPAVVVGPPFPPPTCSGCGAVPRPIIGAPLGPHGPVIEMVPPVAPSFDWTGVPPLFEVTC